jgi:hypothetical protein
MTTDTPCDTHGIARCTICLPAPPPKNPALEAVKAKVIAEHGDRADFTDVADTHPSIAAAYRAAVDVRVLNGVTRVERVGRVALTRGARPAFLLVEPKWKGGTHLLGHNDVVVAARTGGPKAPKGGWVTMARVEDHNGSKVL